MGYSTSGAYLNIADCPGGPSPTAIRIVADRQSEDDSGRRGDDDDGSTPNRHRLEPSNHAALIVPVSDREDRHGLDETRNHLAAVLGKFVPQRLARRALEVAVETDRERYARGEAVTITATFHNRLPLPITIRTPRQRRWGWSVDGELEASDETRYIRQNPGTFAFRPRERKHVEWTWNGRFERTDEGRWVRAEPREHEITAFVAIEGDDRPSATTTVQIE